MSSIAIHNAHLISLRSNGDVWLAGTILLFSSGAFLSLLRSSESLSSGSRTGSIVTDLLWIGIYLFTLYCWHKNRQVIRNRLQLPWHIAALYLVALASILWSDSPAATAPKLVALGGSLMISCYLAMRFSAHSLLKILARVFLVSMVLSLLVGIFVPAVGIGSGDIAGMWQGIYTHKNTLGLNMALAFAVFLAMATTHHGGKVYYLAAAFAILLVLLSQSSTSLLLCLVILVAYAARRLVRDYFRISVTLLMAMLAFLFTFDWEVALTKGLDLVNRDPTLTGRTDVWVASIIASEHLWLGYGYGAFWRGADGPSFTVWKLVNWEAFYSHNGFLDVWLDLGFVGLGIVVMGIAISFRSALLRWKIHPLPENLWHVLFILYLVASNLTEGTLLGINVLSWILYVAISIQLRDGNHRGIAIPERTAS
jgi:exopolysaccharide production protein ExoQ